MNSKYYEQYAARAAQGEVHPWNRTPIFDTLAAQRSDPMRGGGAHLGDRWWAHVDVEPSFLREQGTRLARSSGDAARRSRGGARRNYGRDAVEEENRQFAATDAYEFSDYLPSGDEDVYGWLANLRIYVDATDERKAAFEALDRFVHGFPVGTRGDGLPKSKLRDLLTDLCSQPGGLLVPR